MSLRSLFASSVIALVALVVLSVASLVLITSFLHVASGNLRAALLRADAANSLESELLRLENDRLRARLGNPRPKSEPPGEQVRADLATLDQLVETDEGRALYGRLEDRVDAYLSAIGRSAPEGNGAQYREESLLLDAAVAATARVQALGERQALDAMHRAARLDAIANGVGYAVAALLVMIVAFVLVTTRRRIYHPMQRTRDAIERFGRGDRTARAPVDGLSELADIARTFNATADQLERQINSMAVVAHDLRNPLAALGSAVGAIRPDRPLPSEETLRRVAALAGRQVARLDRMVGDLLDVARIEAGRLELKLGDHDLRTVARDVVELFAAESVGHELRLLVPEEPVPVRVDAGRLEQALNNLVSNALKYSPGGGVVTVEVARAGSEALLAVSDQGVGIAPEERESIFEPFRRSPASRERIPGTGLGLSITRRIVESHGGRIEVESEPGKGSTFRVRLPLRGD